MSKLRSMLVLAFLSGGLLLLHSRITHAFPQKLMLTTDEATVSELQVAHLSAQLHDPSCRGVVQWSADEPGLSALPDSGQAIFSAPVNIESPHNVTVRAWSSSCPDSQASVSLQLVHKFHWQGLVQLQNGMSRASTKPKEVLRQDYRVVFHDSLTGTEIWQIDGDERSGSVTIPGILNRTPWNSNGSRFVLAGTRCIPDRYCPDSHDFVYLADGSHSHPLQPRDLLRSPTWAQTINVNGYAPFDKENPRFIYFVAGPENFPTSPVAESILYEIDIDADDAVRRLTILPHPERRKATQAGISEGNILMIQDANPDRKKEGEAPKYVPSLYFFDLHGKKKMIYSYPIDFRLTFAGHKQDEEYHLHDIAFRRNPQSSYIFNYGMRSDVGEAVIIEMPIDGDAHKARLACKDPDTSTPYYSHPAWNSDGSLVAYGGERVLNGVPWEGGVFIRDHEEHKTIAKIGLSSNHIAWDGYDPRYIAFDGWNGMNSYDLQRALTDGSHTEMLVKYPPREQGKGPSVVIGPAQSPDATKVMFAIPLEFVAGQDPKTFIAVDHHPVAPKLSVVTTAPVRLEWVPYLTHREIKGYRVYRSLKIDGDYQQIGGFVSGTNFTDDSAIAGSTYFYAVTAEEYSGLESNAPEVLRVTIGGTSTPEEWKPEYRLLGTPDPPDHVVATPLKPGVWKVSWNRSRSESVRYYNIYYATSGPPQATQSYLIASIPANVASFVYGMADPLAPAAFAVVAVDRQDGTSALAEQTK